MKPKPPPGERFENDAWIEAVAREIEQRKDETGEPFIVRFPWPLGDAQERLVRSLGVTPVYEAGVDLGALLEAVEAA